MSTVKILLVVTNVKMYASGNLETGLWLSELSHIYDAATKKGFEITLASPQGGESPLDPESLKSLVLDSASKKYLEDRAFRELLKNTKRMIDFNNEDFDLVYLAGGHGTMYDFPDDLGIQQIVGEQYEKGNKIGAICHGVGGLLNVRLSNGEYLIKGKKLTGFNWFEESIARRKKEVPFNLEKALKERGSKYQKALIPMTSHVVVDGNLITGQNPFSSKEMAKVVMEELGK